MLRGSRTQAEQSQHEVAQAIERDDRGPQQEQEQGERPDDRECRAFAALEGEAFRGQLAENNVEDGDDDKGNGEGGHMGTGGSERSRQAAQERFNQMRERGFSDPPEGERRDRDAELARSEISIETIDGALERHRGVRSAPAIDADPAETGTGSVDESAVR